MGVQGQCGIPPLPMSKAQEQTPEPLITSYNPQTPSYTCERKDV